MLRILWCISLAGSVPVLRAFVQCFVNWYCLRRFRAVLCRSVSSLALFLMEWEIRPLLLSADFVGSYGLCVFFGALINTFGAINRLVVGLMESFIGFFGFDQWFWHNQSFGCGIDGIVRRLCISIGAEVSSKGNRARDCQYVNWWLNN